MRVAVYYNNEDKHQVEAICEELERRDLKSQIKMLSEQSFQDIQQVISEVKSVAIIISSKGLKNCQAGELQSFISQCIKLKISVIPVLLPGVDKLPPGLLFFEDPGSTQTISEIVNGIERGIPSKSLLSLFTNAFWKAFLTKVFINILIVLAILFFLITTLRL